LSLFDGAQELPFDADAAARHLASADRKLAPLIDRIGPVRLQLSQTPSVVHALGESIVYQQLTGKAAATIFARVMALVKPKRTLTHEALALLSDDALRGAGLSRAKVAALRDLQARNALGDLPSLRQLHALEDEAIVEALTAVRGIGRWTAEMLLIFRLGRPDVLPATDYGVRKGFALTMGKRALPEPKALLRHGERWRPYRSVAAWYLWRALDSPAGRA
jgi:3-methyladenine DNA glycosylase/8-oxoguanine DNA glycosylase